MDDLDEIGEHLVYELKSTKPALFPHTGRWELLVTPEIPLELDLNTSVGEMLLDLEGLKLDTVHINQGVGRIFLELPKQADGKLFIKQGVGVIEVEIPADAKIAVDAQNGLTRVKFPADFELDDGYYMNPGTTEFNADLMIVVEQGVGLVSFEYKR